jgi:hypothetical protein
MIVAKPVHALSHLVTSVRRTVRSRRGRCSCGCAGCVTVHTVIDLSDDAWHGACADTRYLGVSAQALAAEILGMTAALLVIHIGAILTARTGPSVASSEPTRTTTPRRGDQRHRIG